MQEFSGKHAVVTGGASGVGLAICHRLAREGMRIVVADVEEPALAAAVDALKADGAEAIGVVTDVSKFESVEALEHRAVEAFGPVHVLCNNAGVGAHEDVPLWELPLSDWRWCLAVNVWGVIHGIKAFVPGMLAHGEEGHVVNTSSSNGGLMVVPSTPIYTATKASVSTISETLHLQLTLAQSKLHASVLYPGPHIVASNIFSAARNRTAEFRRELPQKTELPTLESLQALAKQAGMEMPSTTPAEVAEHFFDGIHSDAFYILPTSKDGDTRIRERFERILGRRNPAPPSY